MRTRFVVVLSTLLVIGVLTPTGAWARRVTAGGSLALSAVPGPLTTQLSVTAITSNPGQEKSIVQQLPLPGPLYVLPFFVNQDTDHPQSGDIDTVLLITNTTATALEVTLVLRSLDGSLLALRSLVPFLGPLETRVVPLSSFLP